MIFVLVILLTMFVTQLFRGEVFALQNQESESTAVTLYSDAEFLIQHQLNGDQFIPPSTSNTIANPFQCFVDSSSSSTSSTCDYYRSSELKIKSKNLTSEPYKNFENEKRSTSTSFFRRQFVPPPILPPENGNQSSLGKPDGYIEGTGTYLCIFRGSQLGGQLFIRDVGIFRCSFQGGLRTKNVVAGIGYYECMFQKPGQEQTVTFGVGQYICLLQGVRRVLGFPNPLVAPKYKSGFIEVLGTVNADWGGIDLSTALPGQAQGQLQLFGIYQFGPEGQGHDYGFIQALETLEIQLENKNEILNLESSSTDSNDFEEGKELTKEKKFGDDTDLDLIEPRSRTASIKQLGQFIYAFKETDIDKGRTQINQNMGYTIGRAWGNHSAHLYVARYDYAGVGQWLGLNEDIIQIWGFYEYKIPGVDDNNGEIALQAIVIGEYDLVEGRGLNYVQMVGKCEYDFVGPGTNIGSLILTGMYQANSELTMTGDTTDLLMGVFRLTYVMTGQRVGESGFIVVWGMAQYYLEIEEERTGFVDIIINYVRVFPGNGKSVLTLEGTSISFSAFVIYEFNVPDANLNNGFVHLLVEYTIDISAVASGLGLPLTNLWKKSVPGQTAGVIKFSFLYKCIFFGLNERTKYVCYVIIYALYELDILGGDGSPGPRQIILQTQYFQELSNDNIKEE